MKISFLRIINRFKASLFAVVVFLTLIAAFTYNYFINITASKLHYIDLSQRYTHQVAEDLNDVFRDIYQGLRTIARLPSVRNIDRYADNLDEDTQEAIQEIYNNLNTQLRMSEVYIVPAEFDPERIDPRTGKLESTIITYDEFAVGNLKEGLPVEISLTHDVEEIEIFEYRAMVEQINWFKQFYAEENRIDGFKYPALSSPEVVTCDNSFFSPLEPNDKDRAGLVYSVPFYSLDGKLKGTVVGVVLTHVLRTSLPNNNYVLENNQYGYRIEKHSEAEKLTLQKQPTSDKEPIYSETLPLKDNDENGSWHLSVKQGDSEFWDNIDVIGLQKLTFIGFGFSGLFSFLLFLAIKYSTRFQDIYHKNPTILFTLSQYGDILSSNEYGAKKLGYSPKELEGQNIDILLGKNNVSEFQRVFLTEDSEGTQLIECEFICKTKQALWLKVSARVISRNLNDKVALLVGQDVSEAFKLREQLEKRANYDMITGLLNRWGFEQNCEALLKNSETGGDVHSLLFLDLDDFKIINDTSGHAAGDELLKQISLIFSSFTRQKDLVGRLGGDEFGIIFVDCNEQAAQGLAKKIVEAVKDFSFKWQDDRFSIGVSIGIVSTSHRFNDLKDLFLAADTACYIAKNQGRSRYHLYKESDVKMEKRHGDMQWRSRIEKAMAENGFTLVYQPIVSLNSSETIPHFEVLLRYREADGSLTAPGAFLPASERYGMMVKLDYWVVRNTVNWLQKNMKTDCLCSINLSGRSVGDETFLSQLLTLISESGVKPSNLCFEITETAVMTNVGRAITFVEKLKEIGCKFSLDDFGSGLSSFAYLKTFPVDFLKIDGQFVKDINSDELDYAMVRAIADIGRSFSIQTIAEFVEDQNIIEKLKELDVNYAQGYLYGKPKPLDEMFKSLS